MVPHRPHAALIWPLEEVVGPDGVLGNPTPSGNVAAARGFLEALPPHEGYERYGVELRSPATFQVELSDAGKFEEGSEVLIGSRYYSVIGRPLLFDAGLETDHAEILLEGKDTPVKGV